MFWKITKNISKLGRAKKIPYIEATVSNEPLSSFPLYKIPTQITADNGMEFKKNKIERV